VAVNIVEVVLGIRSRLGDTDVTSRDYSDPEIIDAVNSALAHLSEDLLCFRRIWRVPCVAGVGRYELPSDFLRFISVNYNGTLITEVESMEHRVNRSYTYPRQSVSLDLQTLHLFPAESIKSGDVIELYYNYFETIGDDRDTIALPNNAKEAMIYFALGLLFENNISAKGMEKSNRYKKLYEMEVQKLASRVQMNAQSKNIRTRYRKV